MHCNVFIQLFMILCFCVCLHLTVSIDWSHSTFFFLVHWHVKPFIYKRKMYVIVYMSTVFLCCHFPPVDTMIFSRWVLHYMLQDPSWILLHWSLAHNKCSDRLMGNSSFIRSGKKMFPRCRKGCFFGMWHAYFSANFHIF